MTEPFFAEYRPGRGSQDPLTRLGQELNHAHLKIEKLKEEKQKLRTALAETIKKKDKLHQEAVRYCHQLRALKLSHSALQADQEAKDLELEERNSLLRERTSVREDTLATSSAFLEAVHARPDTYALLKKQIVCSHKFKDGLAAGQAEDALLAVMKFVVELLHTEEAKKSPSESESSMLRSYQESPNPFQLSREFSQESKAKQPTPKKPERCSMGPTGRFVVPLMRKEDGWTPKEMFSQGGRR